MVQRQLGNPLTGIAMVLRICSRRWQSSIMELAEMFYISQFRT